MRRSGLQPVAGHPGDRPRPARRVAVRVRVDRGDVRADGGRAAAPAAHRGRARCRRGSSPGRRARRRCRTSAIRSRPRRSPVLSRVLRSNLLAGLQDVALWHERDISHSSVERVVLPDSSHARPLRACVDSTDCSPGSWCSPNAWSGQPRRRATGSCSANRCCWRSWRRARRATTPIGSCSATRCRRGTKASTSGRCWKPTRHRGVDRLGVLDEAFDLQRSLRNIGVVFEQLDAIDRS